MTLNPQRYTPTYAVCNTCTVRLVNLAYQRAPWFRLLREPLKIGMRVMARMHGIDSRDYIVRTPACYGCVRFLKTALKEKSAVFRWLNERINPRFDRILESIVSPVEVQEAKRYARQATHDQMQL